MSNSHLWFAEPLNREADAMLGQLLPEENRQVVFIDGQETTLWQLQSYGDKARIQAISNVQIFYKYNDMYYPCNNHQPRRTASYKQRVREDWGAVKHNKQKR